VNYRYLLLRNCRLVQSHTPPQINGFNYVFTFPSNINISGGCWPGLLLLSPQPSQLCARTLPANVQPCAVLRSRRLQGNPLNQAGSGPGAPEEHGRRRGGDYGVVDTFFTLMRWVGVAPFFHRPKYKQPARVFHSPTGKLLPSEPFPAPRHRDSLGFSSCHTWATSPSWPKGPRTSLFFRPGPGGTLGSALRPPRDRPAGSSWGSHQIPQHADGRAGQPGDAALPTHTLCKSEYYLLCLTFWAGFPRCRGLPGDVTRGGRRPHEGLCLCGKGQANPRPTPRLAAGKPAAVVTWHSRT